MQLFALIWFSIFITFYTKIYEFLFILIFVFTLEPEIWIFSPHLKENNFLSIILALQDKLADLYESIVINRLWVG